MDKEIEIIRDKLSKEELLCQLAEECAELGQAALKLRRAISEEDPTPDWRVRTQISVDKAMDDLIEEIADVRLVVSVLKYDVCESVYQTIMQHKIKRWVSRLEGDNV